MKAIVAKSHKHSGSLLHYQRSGQLVFDEAVDLGNSWPTQHDFERPDHFPLGRQARQGRIAEIVRTRQWENSLWLTIVPSMGCAMSCGYCYARDSKPEKPLDVAKFSGWLDQHGHRFESALVYGGDGLNFAEHAQLLRNKVQNRALVAFVTGLGFTETTMLKKVECVASAGAGLCISIDPPGDPYTRIYAPFPGMTWYHELIRRIAMIRERFPDMPLGFRPTLTATGYGYRRLRSDIAHVIGNDFKFNFEPAEEVPTDGVVHQLSADIDEILAGRRTLTNASYLAKRVSELLNPDIAFAGGGCGHYFQKVSIGPDGRSSFCHEVPTKPQDRDEWSFGDNYGQVINKVYQAPEECQKCSHELSCGTSCPIKLHQGKTQTCSTHKLLTDAALQILADTDPVVINSLAARRAENLHRWAAIDPLTEEELNGYAKTLPLGYGT